MEELPSGRYLMALVCDTHAALWYLNRDNRLSVATERTMDEAMANGIPLYIPSICLVELTYLVEKTRLPSRAIEDLLDALADRSFGFKVAVLDLAVAAALRR